MSCEHASNKIPLLFAAMFTANKQLLASHRGWDPGAIELALFLKNELKVKLISGAYSRLLIDLNRDFESPDLFSIKTQSLSTKQKNLILKKYYFPYRKKIMDLVAQEVQAGQRVLHVSVHSFTPIRNGVVRETDIGLLFNPERKREFNFCQAWSAKLQEYSDLRIKLNSPYFGTNVGVIPILQKKYGQKYLGLELEINHKILKNKRSTANMHQLILETLRSLL